jgi:2-polyprenyl-3-methyl-5-hydroxy-6-metoxy-1,4-benzoquinol methylase
VIQDPVRQWQSYVSRAGNLLVKDSLETTRLDNWDDAARERFYEKGEQQVATLQARIEAQTGRSLESCRALDFGCGAGRTALPLARRCEYLYGLDVSQARLREADRNAKRLNLSNVEWLEAEALADLSGQYDLVVSFWVFQHIASREGERIFATILKGLRPGGVGAIHFALRPRFRGSGLSYLYMLTNSYSLHRLGRVLADEGITEWHARWHTQPVTDDVTIIFRKD